MQLWLKLSAKFSFFLEYTYSSLIPFFWMIILQLISQDWRLSSICANYIQKFLSDSIWDWTDSSVNKLLGFLFFSSQLSLFLKYETYLFRSSKNSRMYSIEVKIFHSLLSIGCYSNFCAVCLFWIVFVILDFFKSIFFWRIFKDVTCYGWFLKILRMLLRIKYFEKKWWPKRK